MSRKAYLSRTMLRRLLTCLALLTGLGTVAMPAQAHVLDALDRMEVAAQGSERARTATATCMQRQQVQRQRGERVSPCPEERAVRILIPTIMFGADRAYE